MFDYSAVSNFMNSMVPITRFNKGEASKIFDEVIAAGIKIVVKNNKPSCVLMAPEKYAEMSEELENYRLIVEADHRIQIAKGSDFVSQEDILKRYNNSDEEFDGVEVEIE